MPEYSTIVREHYFELQLRRVHKDVERADEYLEGVEWVLARDPSYGTPIGGDSIVWFVALGDGNSIGLNLYYTFDSDNIFFLAIEIAL